MLRIPRHLWAIVFCFNVGAMAWPNEARGQPAVMADKLFQQAREYMMADNYAAACPLLDQSYQLDPRDGTLFTLANCWDHADKYVAAIGHYRAYLRASETMNDVTRQKHAPRIAKAQERLAIIEPLVAMVKFVRVPHELKGLTVLIDGVALSAQAINDPVPLDPGTHEIVVQSPGEPNRTHTVTLNKGESMAIDVIPEPPKTEDRANVQTSTPSGFLPADRAGRMRMAGFIGMGVGAASIVAGTVTGALAVSEKSTVNERCDRDYYCDLVGKAAADRLQSAGNASTASFIVGGLFLGAGITLFTMSRRVSTPTPTDERRTTTLVVGNRHISIQGAF